MKKEKIHKRLNKILDHAPRLKQILESTSSLSEKRIKIRQFLTDKLNETFSDNPAIPPLEWILARDAIQVFRSLISERSERLAGFSILKYLDDLLHEQHPTGIAAPSTGFLEELKHLVKGVAGKTGVYSEKAPAFIKHTGRKAAGLRSQDLSRMARKAQQQVDRYQSGLEPNAVRRRSKNKSRILQYFNATDLEWENWRWHMRNIIRDADTLKDLIQISDQDFRAVQLARRHKVPFGITPYYLSLIDFREDNLRDRAIRAQVIPSLHYVKAMIEHRAKAEMSMDFMLEHDTSPIDGITRRYPEIVILKPVLTCPQICVYCQRNWEIEDVYSPWAVLSENKLKAAIQWIADTPEIREVLITGGDPLLLSDSKIEDTLAKLSKNKNIERIRIGSRTPVTLPQRITDKLVKTINRFHIPGKREIVVITHFEHCYEISRQTREAVLKFRNYGIDVYNQMVYTFFNSRRFEACALRKALRLIGVTPYYTFNTKGKEETDDFRVPIARLIQEQHEEARLMPGTLRTDEIVFNVPGLGKNYLRARQHHDIISVLPDGRRIYEFHPWEKKLYLADTYLYTDVSIYVYLRRLKAVGENPADYNTIWYYY